MLLRRDRAWHGKAHCAFLRRRPVDQRRVAGVPEEAAEAKGKIWRWAKSKKVKYKNMKE